MTILVTGAGGQLGRLVVDALLKGGTPAAQIRAGSRDPRKLADLAEQGVQTVRFDFDDQASVTEAVQGADRVLLISGAVPGARVEGHRRVIQAAKDAGVEVFAYTSAPKADSAEYVLAPDHKATEAAIAEAGIPAVILRNGWYTENYLRNLPAAQETGVIAAAVGDGKVASASRSDYAEAAAAVLAGEGHVGNTYELAGDHAWDYNELATAASEVLGRPVTFVPRTPEELTSDLLAAGVDEGTAGFAVAVDAATAAGVLGDTDGTLSKLIGHPTTPLREGLAAAWQQSQQH